MHDICSIQAKTTQEMLAVGKSLASTLHTLPLTILLQGELGAGKTTLVQGLARGLGVTGAVTSPTYALEQRYHTPKGELIHIDLYRLKPQDARQMLHSTEHHTGIRCIEWAERADLIAQSSDMPMIDIRIAELPEGRTITAHFHDIPLPSDKEIAHWRALVHQPQNVIAHCNAAGAFAEFLAKELSWRGRMVRPLAMRRAGEVHDLLRFLDFRDGAGPATFHATDTDKTVWEEWTQKFPNTSHEAACAQFLRERSYAALADIVATHGLKHPPASHATIEQQLLYYADKRVRDDQIVTLDERFADFAKRYGNGPESVHRKTWYTQVKDIEAELFGNEVPGADN